MDYENIVHDVVDSLSAQKVAARWETMSQRPQRYYLKKHPESKKKVTPTHIHKRQQRKKTKHQMEHKLKHMKHRNKLNFDALHNV